MTQSSLLQNKPSKGPVLQSVTRTSDWGELRLVCAPLNGQKHWLANTTSDTFHLSSTGSSWRSPSSLPSCPFLPALPPLLSQLYRPSYLRGQTKNQMRIIFNSNQFTYVFSTVLTDSCINTSEGVMQGQDQAARMKQGKGTWTGQGLHVPTAPTKKTQPKVSTWPSQLQLHEVMMWSCQSSISLQAPCIDKNYEERGQADPRFGTSSSGLSGFAVCPHTMTLCHAERAPSLTTTLQPSHPQPLANYKCKSFCSLPETAYLVQSWLKRSKSTPRRRASNEIKHQRPAVSCAAQVLHNKENPLRVFKNFAHYALTCR